MYRYFGVYKRTTTQALFSFRKTGRNTGKAFHLDAFTRRRVDNLARGPKAAHSRDKTAPDSHRLAISDAQWHRPAISHDLLEYSIAGMAAFVKARAQFHHSFSSLRCFRRSFWASGPDRGARPS